MSLHGPQAVTVNTGDYCLFNEPAWNNTEPGTLMVKISYDAIYRSGSEQCNTAADLMQDKLKDLQSRIDQSHSTTIKPANQTGTPLPSGNPTVNVTD